MNESPAKQLTVIVLCTHHGAVIKRCDDELMSVLPSLGLEAEVLYVINGKTDDAAFQLQSQAGQALVPRRLLQLKKVFPINTAFAAGVDHAQGEVILTIDPELTVDPAEILGIFDQLEDGYDAVIGWRQRQHLSRWIRLRSRLVNRIASQVTGLYLHDYGCPFRIYTRKSLQAIPLYGNLYAFVPIFLQRNGALISELPVVYRPDNYIGHEYTPFRMVASIFDLISVWFLIRHADHPLRLFGGIGALFILASMVIIGGAILNRAAFEVSLIQTPLPTLSGILLAIGIQTMLLGLVAELLVQSLNNLREAPVYSVQELVELP